MATDPRIDTLVTMLESLARLDFSARAEVTPVGDEVDALAGGLNMLAEELEASTVSRERFQERESRLSATFDAVLDALVVIDGQGEIVRVNQAAEQLFGYGRGELTTKNVRILMPEPMRSEHDGYIERYRQTKVPKVIGNVRQVDAVRSDGEVFPAEISITEVKLAKSMQFVGVVRDISDRLRVDRMKSEFVSVVSHELRTPLTSIRGSLGLLERGVAGALDEKAAEMVGIALRNTERLVRLINDILDIERIAEGKLVFQSGRIEVADLVAQVLESHRQLASERSVALETSITDSVDWVAGDGDRITQVLTNLLTNALKFSSAGSKIWIEVVRRPDDVVFEVRDEGEGIPEDFRPRLFERFAQADSSTQRAAQGSGLGLSICKAIVEQHGGQIWFQSEVGAGTSMFFSLPRPAEAREQGEGGESIDGDFGDILICEDDVDAARVLAAMFEAYELRCDMVHDADTARERLRDGRYALLILDLGLGETDGLSLIRSLRGDGVRTPIVVVSGSADATGRELGGEFLEVVDWIQKPPDPERVLAALEQATRRERAPVILVVEDDPDLRTVVVSQLGQGLEVRWAPTVREARGVLRREDIDLVVLDLSLPDGSGLALLPELRHANGDRIPVVVFAASEIAEQTRASVTAALVKSKASVVDLVETVRAALATGTSKENDVGDP